jgi:hypothetical protein
VVGLWTGFALLLHYNQDIILHTQTVYSFLKAPCLSCPSIILARTGSRACSSRSGQ